MSNDEQAQKYSDLINKLHNWQLIAYAAFILGIAIGVAVVGISNIGGW